MSGDSKKPLDVQILDNRLVISIGIDTLAHAFEKSGHNLTFHQTERAMKDRYQVTDHIALADDVVTYLQERA